MLEVYCLRAKSALKFGNLKSHAKFIHILYVSVCVYVSMQTVGRGIITIPHRTVCKHLVTSTLHLLFIVYLQHAAGNYFR